MPCEEEKTALDTQHEAARDPCRRALACGECLLSDWRSILESLSLSYDNKMDRLKSSFGGRGAGDESVSMPVWCAAVTHQTEANVPEERRALLVVAAACGKSVQRQRATPLCNRRGAARRRRLSLRRMPIAERKINYSENDKKNDKKKDKKDKNDKKDKKDKKDKEDKEDKKDKNNDKNKKQAITASSPASSGPLRRRPGRLGPSAEPR